MCRDTANNKMTFGLLFLFVLINGASAQNDDARIIGGTNAILGQNPYHVSLQTKEFKHYCSGAIINSRWVITAAHCISSQGPSTLMTGSVTLNPAGAMYEVAISVKHYFYLDLLFVNDIALVKSRKDFVFGPNVQPIGLAAWNVPDGIRMTVTGWGTTTFPERTNPNELQTLDMPTVNQGECAATMKQFDVNVLDSMICVRKPAGQGLCYGDSGGPLVNNNKLYGVVSFLYPCAYGYPEVSTRVSSYGFWIWFTQLIFAWF